MESLPEKVRPVSFDKQSFLLASRMALPMVVGSLPFAVITGAITVNAGISPGNSFLMSFLISAGAAQIAALEVLSKSAPLFVVVLTGLLVNLRLVMYSASLAPHLKEASPAKKLFLSFILYDQSYALSIMEFSRPGSTVHKVSYYMGASLTIMLVWQIGVIAGIMLGGMIPASWSLDFAVPLTFLFLLTALLKEKPAIFAAGTAIFFSVGLGSFPYNLNVILGGIAGIFAGYWAERSTKKHENI